MLISEIQLRHDMIDQKEGETEFSVKVHYDDMVSMKMSEPKLIRRND
jgi:hypothetical protein